MSLPLKELDKIIRQALQEDAARQDITSRSLIPANAKSRGVLLAKEDLVVCGWPVVTKTFKMLDRRVQVRPLVAEGKKVKKGKVLARIHGPTRGILGAERVALNFFQRMSGIATLTWKYAEQVKGTRAKILDTRKTTPGLRILERHAVVVGGGHNHRFDLQSAVMVKDNHLAVLGSLSAVMAKLKKLKKKVPVIVEVETLSQLKEALALGAKYLQLDNMSLTQLKKAVALVGTKAKTEATGGINLKNIRAVAKARVNFISVGAITHSAPAVDVSLELNL